jgi:NTE family protein
VPAGIASRRRLLLCPASSADDDPSCDYRLLAWSASRGTGIRGREVPVDPPTGVELSSISEGTLPAREPAGRALGWVARDIAGLKVGLALGAGNVRGFAHIGVLRVLQQAGLPIDFLTGSSIGAPVAGMLAAGDGPDAMLENLLGVGRATFRPRLPRHGLLSCHGVRDVMRRVWGETRIEDLQIPLGIVAVDIEARRQVVFHSGLLWLAALASIAIPGVYPPIRIGDKTLVDGAVLNPLPVDVSAAMGADRVVGVRLGDVGPTERVECVATSASPPSLSILQVLLRSIDAMQAAVNISPSTVPAVVIEPRFPRSAGFPVRDFGQGARFVAHGEAAAELALDRLRGLFPWLS